jgi:Uma2 family endonuclease
VLAKRAYDDYLYRGMQAVIESREWTEEALMALPRDGRKYELLGGRLLVSPTGFQHGYIAVRLTTAMQEFGLRHRLGVVVDSSTGFRLKNGDCLSPDLSFVRKERLGKELTPKFFPGAPDLAVEVLSPGESLTAIDKKLAAYFADEARLAWVVNPKDQTVRVHHSPRRFRTLRAGDCLDGEDLLPGFSFPVAALFELPDFGT